tara:strand:- start:743 stop:1285 length:543 start_codon:yes stop_codon:yes gene_type:complete
MVSNELIKDALYGVLYFATVFGLIKTVQPHGPWAVVGVLYLCTFCLYWFFYKIRDVKHYLVSFAVLGGILLAFYVAGKAGLVALIILYIAIPIWILYSRRAKIKEGYAVFEKAADNVFFKVEEKNEEIVVKAKKPLRTTKQDKSEHKQKQKTRKKNTSKTSKSRTVKKSSKNRRKKPASD